MAQGALGAGGVRRVSYGLEVGRSMRTSGGAGHIVSPHAQLVEAKDDGGGGDKWTTGAISHVKLQPKSSPTNQHPVCYWPEALPVAQSTVLKHRYDAK